MTSSLLGFRVIQVLHRTVRTMVLRAVRDADGRAVVLKTHAAVSPGLAEFARLRAEARVLRTLQFPGVVQLVGEEVIKGRPVLVLADTGGHSLREHAGGCPLTPREVVDLALRITAVLAEIHGRGFLHGDLNPSHVVVSSTGSVEIVGFGRATTIRVDSPAAPSGTLAYLPPEASGRMATVVDERADFYSLGATLYELLVGRPPFVSPDPLEVVHGHLARQPIAPREAVGTGRGLSDLVMKLLAKSPDCRYEGAEGIMHDLEACRRSLAEVGRTQPFELGTGDVPRAPLIPSRLYGREAEIRVVRAALERATGGAKVHCLLHGPAGVGKSSLADVLRVADGPGLYVAGRADALQRAVPYAPLVQALSAAARWMLSRPASELAAWRETLRESLGGLVGVLAETVPAMADLVGPQAHPPVLGPSEAANRVDRALILALKALSSAGHPAVLFLDDLQWADHATIRVAAALAADAQDVGMLLLLAWRSDEVDDLPVQAILQRLRASPRLAGDVALDGLDEEGLSELLQDALGGTRDEVAPLVHVVSWRTRGNPFFVRQFLSLLSSEGHLRFDRAMRRWTWDAEMIRGIDLAEDVLALLETRLRRLPASTREALQAAACVGPTFPLGLVATALGWPEDVVARALLPALEEDLLGIRAGDLSLVASGGQETPAAALSFLHDRVIEAVLAGLTLEVRASYHLALGRHLMSGASRDETNLYDAARHLNAALPLLVQEEERLQVARLDLQAGRKALRDGSFDTALEYLGAGLALAAGWDRSYDLMLELHLQAAAAAAMLARVEVSEKYLQAVLRHARTPLERARALEIRLRDLMMRALYPQALQVGFEALEHLGERFLHRSSRVATAVHLARTMFALRRKGRERLASRPMAEEPGHELTMSLLIQAALCAILVRSDVAPRMILRAVDRSLRFGRTSETCTAIGFLAVLQGGVLGNLQAAEQLADLALQLTRGARPSWRVRAELQVHHLVRHWTRPLRSLLELTPRLFSDCLEAGDHEFAPTVAWGWCRLSFLAGIDLATLRRRLDSLETEVRPAGAEQPPPHWRAERRMLECLIEPHPGPSCKPRDIDMAFEQADRSVGYLGTWSGHLNRIVIHLLFGEPQKALPFLTDLEECLKTTPPSPDDPFFVYMASLIRLGALPGATVEHARHLRGRIRADQARLTRWSGWCSQNHLHRCHMVEAEIARADGHLLQAAAAYDLAAEAAQEQGFAMDEALALERCGSLHLANGRRRLARTYLEDARQAWLRWGARAKAVHLEAMYAELLSPPVDVEVSVAPLDTSSAFKAATAISGEVMWERLVQRLLRIAMENAGARRGVLVMEREGRLRAEAEGSADRPEAVEVASRILGDEVRLAMSVVRCAYRALEPVALDDATTDPTFAGDPYVRSARPRSILAVPIRSGGRTGGVLYLENDLAAGVFTRDRVEVLRLLSAQMAISLENARQFRELQVQQERIMAERELRHAEEVRSAALQARNSGLASFLGIASHDLKGPLVSIQTWMRQLGAGLLDVPHAQAHIEAACRRASGLIRTYLDAVAVESGGQIRLNRRHVDLDQLVEEEIDFLLSRYLIEERARVALAWDLEPVRMAVDAERLQQVVGNLVGNALECCPLGTPIVVTLSPCEGGARLEVDDQGPGIPEALRDTLFQPFERGRHEVGASGLGLWISRLIVEAHGGRITLENRPRGTRFLVDLPRVGIGGGPQLNPHQP